MSRFSFVITSSLVLAAVACGGSKTPKHQQPGPSKSPAAVDPAAYVAKQTQRLQPLQKAADLAWWQASTTGTKPAFEASRKATNAVERFLADPERFATVKALRAQKAGDPLVRRQLEILYRMMLGKQVEPALLERVTALQTEVEQAFNTYRGTIKGKQVTQGDIEKILLTSTSDAELRAAWEAQKGVGGLVAPKIVELVKLRNQVAKRLGFRDYYALRLAEDELDETQLMALFDELDRLTRGPFMTAKADVDRRLAKRLGVTADVLMPWHYQNPFFQAPPEVFATGLDALFAKQDTLKVSRRFFEGIGLEVQDIIARSDLYEKPGKSPHAFATDIGRTGDIRVLANIVPSLRWQQTMVHELGHAVYDKYLDPGLPWLLRTPTHAMTTEGFAMMLDRVVGNPLWAQRLKLIDAAAARKAAPEAAAYLAFAPLQFSRWTQVMLRFERELYRDPDQNLNALWWKLVEQYQGLKRPPGRNAPDWASKVHVVVAPVYYHSYMLGDLFAAQVHEAIARTLGKPPAEVVYVGEPRVGAFLKRELFAPGARYRWDELTRRITGKPLSPEAFARRFTR